MARRLKIIQALPERRDTSLAPELRGPQGNAAFKLNQDNFSVSVVLMLTVLCPGSDSSGISFLKFHRYCQRQFSEKNRSRLSTEVLSLHCNIPSNLLSEWVEAVSTAEAEILFNIVFSCHSVTFPHSPRRACKYHITVYVPEYQYCGWGFSGLTFTFVSSDRTDRCALSNSQLHQNSQPNTRTSGFKQPKRIDLRSLTASTLFLRWASWYSLAHQQMCTYWLQMGCLWPWRLCTALWGYHDSGLGYAVHKGLCKALRSAVSWGKRDAQERGDMVPKTLLSHSNHPHTSVTAAFGVCIASFEPSFCPHLRSGGSEHWSFNKVSKNLKHWSTT